MRRQDRAKLGKFHWRWWSRSMAGMGNLLATAGSMAAGHRQFRWRSWSIAVAKVGSWLAFCTNADDAIATKPHQAMTKLFRDNEKTHTS
jgi:hypothetical protein